MGRLTRVLAAGLAVLAAGCASVPGSRPGAEGPEVAREAPGGPETAESPASFFGDLPSSPLELRISFPSRPPATPQPRLRSFPQAIAPDIEALTYGWVDDDQAVRLGLARRFWSDQKTVWTEALDPDTPAAAGARKLEAVFKAPGSDDEAFRAVWHLWVLYSRAALGGEARKWLDRAASLRPLPTVLLDQAWDQAFRLGDLAGAQDLWRPPAAYPSKDDARKAGLLRQKLFLGTRNLGDLGADNYVSTVVLDRDDLWAGTWNGAVVRWSLATGLADLILKAGSSVAPVKVLAPTPWFVYAFQDQGFQRYSKVTGTWRPFDYPVGWTGLRIQAVVPAGDETLWVATLGQGLWKWDQGQWSLVDDRGGGPFLNTLAPDDQGGFWVGTKDRGLWDWKDGVWTPVPSDGKTGPSNISVVQAKGSGGKWAVGTWGEGTWLLDGGTLRPVSGAAEYVADAAWDGDEPVWATLDEGLASGAGASRISVGPLDGLMAGGVSSLVVWNGRWIWGTTGQGLGWWSEHENSALLR